MASQKLLSEAADAMEEMILEAREASGITSSVIPGAEVRRYMAKYAKILAVSSLCAAETPADAYILLQACFDLGLKLTMATQTLYIVKGKVALSAQAMRALILASGLVQIVSGENNDEKSASVTLRRLDGNAEHTCTWTIEMAQRAGLTSNPTWKSYPHVMLQNRALAECARIVCPDVIGGLYIEEEAQSIMVDAMDEVKQAHPDLKPDRIGRHGTQELMGKIARAADATGMKEEVLLEAARERCIDLIGSDHWSGLRPEHVGIIEAAVAQCVDEHVGPSETGDQSPELDLDDTPFGGE